MKLLQPKYVLFILVFFGVFCQGFSQSSKREKLEQQRLELQKEISQISKLLSSNTQRQQNVLSQVEDLDKRIKATENLIKVTNQEANLLTKEINENINRISKLRTELEKLKDDYAKMIKKSYKSKSQQSRIMFLFSSKNFLQAYKRLQYMKQYTEYRKEQGEQIKAQTLELQKLNTELEEQRKAKESLLAQNRITQRKLQKDKKAQQELIASIKEKGSEFKQQIKKKQQEVEAIDKEIERLIREAIAAANKAKGSSSTTKFELTPEAKALAASFASNKGKLPWPVKSGVLSMKFGKNEHPMVRNTYIQSNGVRIETNDLEPVRAVFKGEVMKIQAIKGSNKTILISHGNYISVYKNLSSINVEVGDEILTNQVLGKVGRATATGRPTVMFYIAEVKSSGSIQYINPAHWIYKM